MWPELAVFDCAACHHDLRGKSWRRDRGYGASIPGRPQFFAWPTALVKVAIRHRAGSDDKAFDSQWAEFHSNLEKLRRVLDKQPFGNPQQVHAITHGSGEAKGLVQWLDKLADDIFKSPVQAPEAKRALRALVTLGKTDYPDFHSARQTLWAFRTIQSELSVEYPAFKTRAKDESPKQSQERAVENLLLYRDWETGPKAASYEKTDSLLTALTFDKTLRLKLPAGVKYVIAEQLPDPGRVGPVLGGFTGEQNEFPPPRPLRCRRRRCRGFRHLRCPPLQPPGGCRSNSAHISGSALRTWPMVGAEGSVRPLITINVPSCQPTSSGTGRSMTNMNSATVSASYAPIR